MSVQVHGSGSQSREPTFAPTMESSFFWEPLHSVLRAQVGSEDEILSLSVSLTGLFVLSLCLKTRDKRITIVFCFPHFYISLAWKTGIGFRSIQKFACPCSL